MEIKKNKKTNSKSKKSLSPRPNITSIHIDYLLRLRGFAVCGSFSFTYSWYIDLLILLIFWAQTYKYKNIRTEKSKNFNKSYKTNAAYVPEWEIFGRWMMHSVTQRKNDGSYSESMKKVPNQRFPGPQPISHTYLFRTSTLPFPKTNQNGQAS